MIFKQRLSTIVLGLLFAAVLTDQASALYDPGVGRFCSRDPIGYVQSKGLYPIHIRLAKVDPSGNIAIEPILSVKLNNPFFPCEKPSEQAWNFKLSKKASELCNGRGGVIVQKIVFSCSGALCKDGERCDPKAEPNKVEYYEAWYVGPDFDTNSGKFSTGKKGTDKSLLPAVAKKCGSYRSDGTVRFYCSDVTEEDLSKYPELPLEHTCVNNFIGTNGLPSWKEDKVDGVYDWGEPGDDGEATRWHRRDFACCDCAEISDKADAFPKKELGQ